jgi:hypothetical protein
LRFAWNKPEFESQISIFSLWNEKVTSLIIFMRRRKKTRRSLAFSPSLFVPAQVSLPLPLQFSFSRLNAKVCCGMGLNSEKLKNPSKIPDNCIFPVHGTSAFLSFPSEWWQNIQKRSVVHKPQEVLSNGKKCMAKQVTSQVSLSLSILFTLNARKT